MKKLLGILLIMGICNFSFGTDSLQIQTLHKNTDTLSSVKVDSEIIEKSSPESLQKQAEEIPVVFAQWWFWVGLLAIIAFLKFVLFKK